jgi:polysaccharide export outer membrane protein
MPQAARAVAFSLMFVATLPAQQQPIQPIRPEAQESTTESRLYTADPARTFPADATLAGDASLYTLGPEDKITVWAADVKDFPLESIRVDEAGYVTLPLVDRILVQGRNVNQVRSEIADRLKKYLHDPQVTVAIAEFRPRPVSLYGAVTRPGVLQLRGPKTLWEAMSDAGGFRNDAGDKIRITRRADQGPIPISGARMDEQGRYSFVEIDTLDVLELRDPGTNIELMAHDVISVAEADIVYVVGQVSRGGGFVTKGSISALEALSLAGGFMPNAKPSDAAILRADAGTGARQAIPVDLKKVLDGKGEDIMLRPQDILYVPTSTWKQFGVRLLEAGVAAATSSAIFSSIRGRNF